MRAHLLLLSNCLVVISLFCRVSAQSIPASNSWLINPPNGSIIAPAPKYDPAYARPRRNGVNPTRPLDDDYCLMLRTYIMVRESRDSDVTRRDGHYVCQPAHKFEFRSAVGKPQAKDR